MTVTGTVDPANATVHGAGQPASVANGVFTAKATVGAAGRTMIEAIGNAPGRCPGASAIMIARPSQPKARRRDSTSGPSCGAGLSARPGTSCAFASNVEAVYMGSWRGNLQRVQSGDGVTYTMACATSGIGHCVHRRAHASVYFLR